MPAKAQTASQQSYSFSIRPKPVRQALNDISRITGVSVVFRETAAASINGNAVSGTMTRDEALAALLAGTGLSWSFSNANTVTITNRVSAAHNAPINTDGSVVLETITVTGAGNDKFTPDTPFETAGSVNHIARQDLDRIATTSPGDIFRNTPGVIAADGRNGSAVEVNIRGLQGMNRTAVRVDGTLQNVPVYRGYYGASNRTYIDPDLLGGVDITKGPGTGVGGAGTIGGVINMRTLDANDIITGDKDRGARVTVGVASNSVNPQSIGTMEKRIGAPGPFDIASGNGSAIAAGRFGNIEVVAGIARRRQGNYFTGKHGPDIIREEVSEGIYQDHKISSVLPDSEVVNTQRDVLSAFAKGKATFEGGHSVELGYIYYDSDFGEVMPSQISRFSWDNVGQQEPNEVTSHRLSAKYAYDPEENDLIDLRLNVWGSWLHQKTRSATSTIWNPDIKPVDSYSRVPVDTYMAGAEISNTSRVDAGYGELTLTYGGSYLLEDTRPLDDTNWYLPQDGRRHEASAFAQFAYSPLDWLDVQGGLRYTAYRTRDRVSYKNFPQFEDYFLTEYGIARNALDGSGWSPNLGMVVKPVDGIQLFATYTTGYRGPSLTEANFKYDFFPNPDLKAERSKDWEVGLNLLKDDVFLSGDKLRFKASYFDNTIKDYIARGTFKRDAYAWLGLLIPYNMGAAKFAGTEVSASYDAGSWFVEGNGIRYSRIEFCDGVAGYGTGVPVSGCVDHSLPEDYSTNYIPPEYTASATLGVRLFEERLTVGARVNHVGKRAINAPTSVEAGVLMPKKLWAPYTTVDAFASYKFNDNLTLSLSGENLTNRFYMDALSLAAVPAPGRTFRLNMTTRF
ncbi:TonB-dependent receptor [Aquamicrobium lusatiense]|uniref:TonB-dependent receptor n=1 Tax=Aquamicrobium lusatiense TaxID=89772 RepID=UPI002456800A|nr:TonB-dependent receptor [Aquamicrobium lusatiense]MDH4989341.1 TonB-dependent receptor [Aquamicrobium lusatiense]